MLQLEESAEPCWCLKDAKEAIAQSPWPHLSRPSIPTPRSLSVRFCCTLPESSIGAKLTAMENLTQIALLSAPTAPVVIAAPAQQKLVLAVADTDADVTHFFSLHSLADAVLAQQKPGEEA